MTRCNGLAADGVFFDVKVPALLPLFPHRGHSTPWPLLPIHHGLTITTAATAGKLWSSLKAFEVYQGKTHPVLGNVTDLLESVWSVKQK